MDTTTFAIIFIAVISAMVGIPMYFVSRWQRPKIAKVHDNVITPKMGKAGLIFIWLVIVPGILLMLGILGSGIFVYASQPTATIGDAIGGVIVLAIWAGGGWLIWAIIVGLLCGMAHDPDAFAEPVRLTDRDRQFLVKDVVSEMKKT